MITFHIWSPLLVVLVIIANHPSIMHIRKHDHSTTIKPIVMPYHLLTYPYVVCIGYLPSFSLQNTLHFLEI